MELTEKLLVSLGGWDVMKRARAIKASGAVREAGYEPPLLKGRIAEGGREFLAGLRLRNPVDIENLCPCADSRRRAHHLRPLRGDRLGSPLANQNLTGENLGRSSAWQDHCGDSARRALH